MWFILSSPQEYTFLAVIECNILSFITIVQCLIHGVYARNVYWFDIVLRYRIDMIEFCNMNQLP